MSALGWALLGGGAVVAALIGAIWTDWSLSGWWEQHRPPGEVVRVVPRDTHKDPLIRLRKR